MSSYLIYDCEIIKAIPPSLDGLRLPNIEYCGGWDDFDNMGISCIGVASFDDEDWEPTFAVFVPPCFPHLQTIDDNVAVFQISAFAEYAGFHDCIVGFNSVSFDDNLLKANGIPLSTHYDLLRAVRVASGQPPSYVSGQTRGGYGLDALARANFGSGKTGTGQDAPILWQQDRRIEVLRYCINDVRLTYDLFLYALKRLPLVDPTNGEDLRLAHPFD